MKDFEINITDKYPKIITPNYLKNVSNIQIRFEDIYPNLMRPTYNVATIEDNELKIIGGGIVFGFFIFAGVGLFCLFLTNFIPVSSENWKAYWYPSILGSGIIGGILVIVLSLKEKKNERERKRTQDEENYKHYSSELEKYNKLVKGVLSNEFQEKEKEKRCLEDSESNRKSIFKSLEILEDEEIKKGVTEDFYYKFLVAYSHYKVYKSIKFSFYYPDLILLKNNLVIAIEIDEPYSFDSKEPIHYEDSDKARDNYFVNSGFILIRFTENQILTHPEECLELINEIVEYCLSLKKYSKTSTYAQIEEKVLTYEEAFDLAYNNSRNGIPVKIQRLKNKYSL